MHNEAPSAGFAAIIQAKNFCWSFAISQRVPHVNFRLGVPSGGQWREVLNSVAREYAGPGAGNFGQAESAPFPWKGRPHTLTIHLPALSIIVFKQSKESQDEEHQQAYT